MANKYSKYQLQPFASQYVDPKSGKIAEILRERYDQNKAQADLIDRTMANTNVLGGDSHHLSAAKEEIRGAMSGIAKSGNYEDAGLIISEQISGLQTNEALIAAQKSYEARQAELKWQAEARTKGLQVIDFGKDASESHSSWVEDPETGLMKSNIYQSASEPMLDYNGAMKKYVGTIKGDVSKARADQLAYRIMGGYLRGPEGKQDLRRLMQVELDQSLPEEQREELAYQDILKRIKIHTDQQIHMSNETKKLNAQQASVQNEIMGGSMVSTSTGYVAVDLDDIDSKGVFDGNILNLTSKIIEARQDGNDKLAKDYQQMLDTLGNKMYENGQLSEEEYKSYKEFEMDLWDNPGSLDNEDFAKFGNMIKYMTEDRWVPDFTMQNGRLDDWWDRTKTSLSVAAGVSGASALGTGIGSFVVTPIAMTAAALGSTADLAVTLASGWADGFGNVRDVARPQTTDLGIVDSEITQLMQNVENIDRINTILGTKFTEDEIPALKDAATKYYNYKVQQGDAIHEKVDAYDGSVFEGEVWQPSVSEEGSKAAVGIDKAFKKFNASDFRWVGVPEDSDKFQEIVDAGKNRGANGEHLGLVFQGIVSPNLKHMQPTRVCFSVNGKPVFAEYKPSADYGIRKLSGAIADATGKLNFAVMDEVIGMLKNADDPNVPDLAAATLQSVKLLGGQKGLSEAESHETFQEVMKQYLNDIPKVRHQIESYRLALAQGTTMTPDQVEMAVNQFIFEGTEESPALIKYDYKLR